MAAKSSASTLVVYPAPAGEKLSEDFELKVGSQSVPVYQCRVSAVPFNQVWPGYQRPLDQTELASFAYWDMAKPTTVEIVSRRPVESVAIRPSSRGIKPKVDGNRICFVMPAVGQVTVEVNGTHFALHLFANPLETAAPDPQDPNVRYFGPGVHQAGKVFLKSNQTVYVAGGAVVYGSIHAEGATNVHILGRGIVDASQFERGQGGGCLFVTDSRDVTVEGVILRDPDVWCFPIHNSSNINITNIKLIGLWRYNADGIDVCNSQNVAIRNCFIRSFDDSIVVKGLVGHQDVPVRNILAEGCVIWNDWGRALEIGVETCAPEMTDLVFRDCDIIRTDYVALDLQLGDRAPVRNVLFENIRVEVDDVNLPPLIQKGPEDKYPAKLRDFCPLLIVIQIESNSTWGTDKVRGTADHIVFRNISVTGKPQMPSKIYGADAEHAVNDVTIENLRVNGRIIMSLEEAAVAVGPFTTNVRLMAPK